MVVKGNKLVNVGRGNKGLAEENKKLQTVYGKIDYIYVYKEVNKNSVIIHWDLCVMLFSEFRREKGAL